MVYQSVNEGDDYKTNALIVCQKAAVFAAKSLVGTESEAIVTSCAAKRMSDSAHVVKITFSAANRTCSPVSVAVVGETKSSPEQFLILDGGSCSRPIDFAFLMSLYKKDPTANKYRICDFVAKKAAALLTQAMASGMMRGNAVQFQAQVAPFYTPTLNHFTNCVIDQEVNKFAMDLYLTDQRICTNVVVDSRPASGTVPERHSIMNAGVCTSYSVYY